MQMYVNANQLNLCPLYENDFAFNCQNRFGVKRHTMLGGTVRDVLLVRLCPLCKVLTLLGSRSKILSTLKATINIQAEQGHKDVDKRI